MKDPVTGFEYPEAWVRACRMPAMLGDVERGLALLTADGTVLRRGFTTGTTAAAACKAALLSLAGDVDGVPVTLPCGITADLPAHGRGGEGRCVKDAGDHPSDVTAGLFHRLQGCPEDGGERRLAHRRGSPGVSRGVPCVPADSFAEVDGEVLWRSLRPCKELEAGCYVGWVISRVLHAPPLAAPSMGREVRGDPTREGNRDPVDISREGEDRGLACGGCCCAGGEATPEHRSVCREKGEAAFHIGKESGRPARPYPGIGVLETGHRVLHCSLSPM